MSKITSKQLRLQVTRLLLRELPETAEVIYQDGLIKIKLTNAQLEAGLGRLLQQLQELIGRHFPERQEDIAVLIGDTCGRYENVFKIWKPL
jgi:hypothetical protein